MPSSTTQYKDYSIANRWLVFINERFPIAEHCISIFFLTLANSAVACAITGTTFYVYRFCIAYIVCLLFFFRLRCFDEIKDYATDKLVNPGRPLARGVLTIGNVQAMFLVVTLIEIMLVSLLGTTALVVHFAAISYSYLMYKEFFIGKRLSPHLTTYAITHTFVSVLVAYSIFAQMTGVAASRFAVELLVFGLATWSIFNLFEFGRKTFAPDEERENVPTYTTTFGVLGAILLSLSQIAACLAVVVYLYHAGMIITASDIHYHLIAAFIPGVAGMIFLKEKSRKSARIFRATCAAYLIAYYALLSYHGLSGNTVLQLA